MSTARFRSTRLSRFDFAAQGRQPVARRRQNGLRSLIA